MKATAAIDTILKWMGQAIGGDVKLISSEPNHDDDTYELRLKCTVSHHALAEIHPDHPSRIDLAEARLEKMGELYAEKLKEWQGKADALGEESNEVCDENERMRGLIEKAKCELERRDQYVGALRAAERSRMSEVRNRVGELEALSGVAGVTGLEAPVLQCQGDHLEDWE